VPTLCTTLGVKGQRPLVGTWDNKDLVSCGAALNLVTGQLTTRLRDQPSHSKAQPGRRTQPRLQAALAVPLRDIARAYPASTYAAVVLTIEKAPWHRGAGVEEVFAAPPHLRVYRLPSYSPQRNGIARFWRVLRCRATPNRLCASMAALRTTLRHNIRYFQTMKQKVLSLIESPRKAKKAAK
jgi:hypothetical protein